MLNNTINNVLSNFISHENITCDNEKSPRFNKNFINLVKNKNSFYKSHTANENITDKKEAIKTLQNKLTSTIENTTLSCRLNCHIQKVALKPAGTF